MGDVSVTIGDLDSDGIHNEVILGIILANYTRLRIYQYLSETETLTYKNQWYEAHDLTGSHELELTSGYVDSAICGDRQSLVMLDTTKYYADTQYHVDARVITYCLMPDTWALVDEYTFTKAFSQASEPVWEPYHSAVAAGDVNVDGFEEVVFSFADKIILIKDIYYDQLSEITLAAYWENRSMSMGDIDRDGKAEVLLSREADGSAHIELFEITPQVDLMKTGESTLVGAGIGTVLTGDLDGDTYISDLAGCATFHEPIVVAVVNGAPVWYQDGAPLHATGGSYSVSKGGGSGAENGTTYNVGGELTLGFKHELNVPVLGIKIGEVRASVKVDYMHSWGFDNTTEEVTVYGTGYGFDDGLGIVVYFDSIYACYYYDLYHPDYPGDKARAMTCRPVAIDIQTKSSLEYWHSDEWKEGRRILVDVGHKSYNGQLTNDLGVAGNYPRSLPIDPNSLVYEWDEDKPLMIAYDPNPAIYNEWWVESEEMTSTLDFYENAGNITVGGGFDAGGFTMDAAVTGGLAGNNGTITSWTNALSFGGVVYAFDVDRPSYSLVPYVYKATATTLAGTTYEYWAVDYYVPDIFPGLQSITLPAKVEPIPD
jgi:hypothetical protein